MINKNNWRIWTLKYLTSMKSYNTRCTWEIKSNVAMANVVI